MFKIIFYQSNRGENHVLEFLESLPENVHEKIIGRLRYIEAIGNMASSTYVKMLRDGIYELRITFGHLEPRILYFFNHKDIVLTHGFLKKTNTVPVEDIERAIGIRSIYLAGRSK